MKPKTIVLLTAWTGLLRLLMLFMVLAACQLISPHSPDLHAQAIELKVQALSLIGQAHEPYADHEPEAQALREKIQQAYTSAQSLAPQDPTTRQWEILASPDQHSVAGFLDFWKQHSAVSSVMADQVRLEIEKHFDAIIELEAEKLHLQQNP